MDKMDINEWIKNLINKINESETIPNAFENWQEYRENLTAFITSSALEGTNIAIIGAGECNDINLKSLVDKGYKITLYDINRSSLEKAIERYSVDVDAVKLDLIDTIPEIYEVYFQMMFSYFSINKDKQDAYLDKIVNNISNHFFMDDDEYSEAPFDYVVVSGVHSQLFNKFMKIANVVADAVSINNIETNEGILDDKLSLVAKKISELNSKYVPLINDKIIRMATKGIILGYEMENTYIQGEGVEGAYQCGLDIEKRIGTQLLVQENKEVIWPFCEDEKKRYKMRLISLNKQDM